MMKHWLLALVAVVLVLGLVGCYATPVRPPIGWVYSDFRAPLSADNQGVEYDTTLHGEAEVQTFLGYVSIGDSSLKTAMENGGIQNLSFADYEYFNILGLYQRFIIHAYGN